ncbi:uncharacterized protein LOC115624259 [Scaptodrosophila lebanonensis]|uniref:Uncharacterized protein LOC115624259 n=1 Tax=Drosophila lebanonensis TaxID=7225 RepID=A0A6J2TI93_DROLE|nr:uncharacterized protein LOC115624259 [Scaptodrosophila lebanonensis]
MNPVCKLNIDSSECQHWMGEVCAHCSKLLANEDVELWDAWWPNEFPPYNPVPHFMSAFECHKLKREVARQVDQQVFEASDAYKRQQFFWQVGMVLIIVLLIIVIIGCIGRILKHLLRGSRQETNSLLCSDGPDDIESRSFLLPYRDRRMGEAESRIRGMCKNQKTQRSPSRPHRSKFAVSFSGDGDYKGPEPYRGPDIVVPRFRH